MRTILVTGGAKRIGRHIVEHFAKQGHQVLFQYYHSETLAKSLLKTHRNVRGIKADLQKPESIQKIFQWAKKHSRKIDLLINNASVFIEKDLEALSLKEFDENFNLNLRAPILMTQAFAKTHKVGHIINLIDSEITSHRTDQISYLLSKKMLAEFTKIAALSLAPKIRVNGIAPGRILPKNKTHSAKALKSIPLQREGKLNDITDAIDALDTMTYITGQILYVAGGKQLKE